MATPSTALLITAFLAIALFASIASKKTRLPYTILLVLIGIALSATSNPTLSGFAQAFSQLQAGGLFVGLILPPLLFESMMSIKVEEFRAVSRPALLLATAGVLIATLVGGLILWRFVGLPAFAAFFFAALVAPTDVATVLEVFGRIRVPSRLATLMETESVFNDATAIAIFTVILTSYAASSLALFSAVSAFLLTFGGGVLVGLGVAWGARQLQREAADPVSQVVLTVAAVYGAYGIATAIGVSGLIAVAVAGLFYGNTVLFRIEQKETAEATRQFWNVLAFVANTVAFLFIGLSTNISSLLGNGEAILVAYLVVVAARFASVYPIMGVRSVAGAIYPWAWRNVAMLGGMRGALSIVLVASVPVDLPSRGVIVSMTFGVAILSIMLQGTLLSRYAGRAFGRRQTLSEEGETVEGQAVKSG